jgi:hypothetical protein
VLPAWGLTGAGTSCASDLSEALSESDPELEVSSGSTSNETALKDAPLGTKSLRSLAVRDLLRRRFFVGRESSPDWAREEGVFLRARWAPNEAVRESASSPESDMASGFNGRVDGREKLAIGD